MITVRRARRGDAAAIGAVHVAAWRSTYPGILPAPYLARLSVARQAAYYERGIADGVPIFVAASDDRRGPRVVGFASAGRARTHGLGDGEIETLYVLDDWREQGTGTALLRQAAATLAAAQCRSAFLWVLADNPSRWFYERLGGQKLSLGTTLVGGQRVEQLAYGWDPIDRLLAASPA